MTSFLCLQNLKGLRKNLLRIDLDISPCPTIMAGGVGNENRSHYWIEDDQNDKFMITNKPPYRVPSMDEIKAIPWNGYNVVSTFSGCGGSCLGFKMDGFRVLWASEFIPAAQDTYRANHPDTYLDTRNIRTVQPQEILDQTGMRKGEIDVLEGSPPCASFSTAGKREKGWGKVKSYSDTRQRVDDLFFEYIRLLDELQPKVFVAENVSGLVKGTAKGYFLEILKAMKACGYRVKSKVLDAQWLGVPQMRQRVIFIGVRNDLNLEPVYPKPFTYRYSVRDAIPWIKRIKVAGSFENWKDANRPSGTIAQSDGARESKTAYLSTYMIETEIDTSRIVIQRGSDPTVAGVTHPTEKRKFSIAELKRICAFPDDFILTGSYSQQWERLGRAVPPVMMYHVARTIREQILCKIMK